MSDANTGPELVTGVEPATPGADRTAVLLSSEMVGTMLVLRDVAQERERQDAQWGGPAHDDKHGALDWESYRSRYERDVRFHRNNRAVMRDALVKIAALAVAQIESLDREPA